jgi:hypothetical protein
MSSLRFLSDWPWPLGITLAAGLALLAWWLYRRETRHTAGPVGWLLPLLRSLAIFLLLMTFLEPVIHHRIRQGEPGKITFLVDASESMTIADDPDASASRSRYRRAVDLLLSTDHSSLQQLAQEFEVTVKRMDGGGQASTLWEATAAHVPELTEDADWWLPASWGTTSPLGDVLAAVAPPKLTPVGFSESDSSAKSIIVMLSDGQSNSGALPLEVATRLAGQNQVVFAVGFGAGTEAADLKLESVNYPKRVFRSDILRGTLLCKEQLANGQQYSASIAMDGEVVWQKQLVAEAAANRSVEFAIALAPLYDKMRARLPKNTEYAVLPLHLEARVSTAGRELNTSNNSQQMYLAVAAQRSRVLVVDGRSRWETRYLHNMFDRDPAWHIDTLITSERDSFRFPESRDDLFKYDLVLFGDVPSDALTREQIGWLREFVELSGGGFVAIPGSRRNLADSQYGELHRMFPIKWNAAEIAESENPPKATPKRVVLTSIGQSLSALRIDPNDETASEEVWKQLPSLQFVDDVEVLPGAEILANAVSEAGSQPLLITRRFGAGRVLFLASDETWRWRYKVADVVHQRLWNQLARWVMRTPMAVQSEFVSLDCGAASYSVGESIEVRAQLRDPSGRASPNRNPTALVSLGDRLVARVPLMEDSNIAGFYSAELSTLGPGEYTLTLEAAGFNREALDVQANFSVVGQPSVEMQELACNDPLLRSLAERTGGQYLRETEAGQLLSRLHPLSTGRFIESDTVIWQTYWWFTAAMALLVGEWWLRKRAGLV